MEQPRAIALSRILPSETVKEIDSQRQDKTNVEIRLRLMETGADRQYRSLGLRPGVVTSRSGTRRRHIFRWAFPALDVFPVFEDETATKDKT
jgi:hypothetical protein